jgi:hypothetical protein
MKHFCAERLPMLTALEDGERMVWVNGCLGFEGRGRCLPEVLLQISAAASVGRRKAQLRNAGAMAGEVISPLCHAEPVQVL